jgi:hypothetical protein
VGRRKEGEREGRENGKKVGRIRLYVTTTERN